MNAGDQIGGKYRLVRQIGAGAMGVVWEAAHELTKKRVAIKLLSRPSDDLRHRLLREARVCGQISHRNVIEVYDVGETDRGEPYLVMQLLTGETLADLLKRKRRLDLPLTAQIGRDISRALDAAHHVNVIHRDLKPANIFLHQEAGTEGVVVKVLDFGVAKDLAANDGLVTAVGGAVGSPAYMSPEALRLVRDLDPRTDIWSLGVVLFEMIAGVRPFQGTGQELLLRILSGPIPRLSHTVRHIDAGFDDVVNLCLQRDRERRIAAAVVVERLLLGHLGAQEEKSRIFIGLAERVLEPQSVPSSSLPSPDTTAPFPLAPAPPQAAKHVEVIPKGPRGTAVMMDVSAIRAQAAKILQSQQSTTLPATTTPPTPPAPPLNKKTNVKSIGAFIAVAVVIAGLTFTLVNFLSSQNVGTVPLNAAPTTHEAPAR